MWECGLKYFQKGIKLENDGVTPLVGVWIEILRCALIVTKAIVTPLVGVWIEIV